MYEIKNLKLFKPDLEILAQRGLDQATIDRIKSIPVPKCLTSRKLIVGDDEQCKALREYEKTIGSIIEEFEENQEYEDILCEYKISISFRGATTVKVKATSLDEAYQKAEEALWMDSIDGSKVDISDFELESRDVI